MRERQARHVERRQRLQAIDVARQRAAHRQELRPVDARQAALRQLQREQRRAHVARELQLLLGDREHLLDFRELPLVAVARQFLVERLQRDLLVLRFGQPRLERADLGLRLAQRLLGLPPERARLAAFGLDVVQALGELLLRRADAAAGIQPERRDDRREHHQRDGKYALPACARRRHAGGEPGAKARPCSSVLSCAAEVCNQRRHHLRVARARDDRPCPGRAGAASLGDARMRHEERSPAQARRRAIGAEHLEKIREPLARGHRDRIDLAARPGRRKQRVAGVGPRPAVARGVLDERAARAERLAEQLRPPSPRKITIRLPATSASSGSASSASLSACAGGAITPEKPRACQFVAAAAADRRQPQARGPRLAPRRARSSRIALRTAFRLTKIGEVERTPAGPTTA